MDKVLMLLINFSLIHLFSKDIISKVQFDKKQMHIFYSYQSSSSHVFLGTSLHKAQYFDNRIAKNTIH